jgi:hypothetical protein
VEHLTSHIYNAFSRRRYSSRSRGLEGFQILVRAGFLLSLYDSFGLNWVRRLSESQTIPAIPKSLTPPSLVGGVRYLGRPHPKLRRCMPDGSELQPRFLHPPACAEALGRRRLPQHGAVLVLLKNIHKNADGGRLFVDVFHTPNASYDVASCLSLSSGIRRDRSAVAPWSSMACFALAGSARSPLLGVSAGSRPRELCGAANSPGCRSSHSAADLRAPRHASHGADLAAHAPCAHYSSDRCALLAALSVPSSPLHSSLALAPACAAAKSSVCLFSHSATDLRALRHAWRRSALAAHAPLAYSASDWCAFRQAAHASPFFLGLASHAPLAHSASDLGLRPRPPTGAPFRKRWILLLSSSACLFGFFFPRGLLPHVHSSSPLQFVSLHSSDIAARLPETQREHIASAVPAPVESIFFAPSAALSLATTGTVVPPCSLRAVFTVQRKVLGHFAERLTGLFSQVSFCNFKFQISDRCVYPFGSKRSDLQQVPSARSKFMKKVISHDLQPESRP